jgi:predicted amidohydrolase
MKNMLDIAFLHCAVTHEDRDANRELLLEQLMNAATAGADIVVAPEMATSGYAFDNPAHAGRFAETLDGAFVDELRKQCRKLVCWACVGMPLVGDTPDIVYNGAVIVDDTGTIRVVYHKVMAEKSWATGGACKPSGVIDTPWGCIGVLICSDTYYGLLPRMRKLQGVDLLLVPANWPPSSLDPKALWATHARNNGMYVAACNRTGIDRTLDCTNAVSCCFDPDGSTLSEGKSIGSSLFTVSLPLEKGRLKTAPAVGLYGDLSAISFNGGAGLHDDKDKLTVYACNGPGLRITTLKAAQPPETNHGDGGALLICFGCSAGSVPPAGCKALFGSPLVSCIAVDGSTAAGMNGVPESSEDGTIHVDGVTLDTFSVQGINVAIVPVNDSRYPELLFRLAEIGCDVVIVDGGDGVNVDDVFYNSVHRMAVVCRTEGKVKIATPPVGHQKWQITSTDENGVCSATVPWETVRNREWLRKIDFGRILRDAGVC